MRKMLFKFSDEEYFCKWLLVIKNSLFLQQVSVKCMLYTRHNARSWKRKNKQGAQSIREKNAKK